MSTDGYCARVWVMAAYEIEYAWHYVMRSVTECDGDNDWFLVHVPIHYDYVGNHLYPFHVKYIRVEVGRAKGSPTSPPKDLTLVGYFGPA